MSLRSKENLSTSPSAPRDREFIHPPLKEAVEFFGGSYLFLEEGYLSYQGKQVLYFLGIGAIESSCCGQGGCAFIKVPGYVRYWKKGVTQAGHFISEIEPIASSPAQKEIAKLLRERHPEYGQVEFI